MRQTGREEVLDMFGYDMEWSIVKRMWGRMYVKSLE
jgi:hypothetical protein